MNWKSIFRLLGVLTAAYSVGFLPSVAISLWYDDGQARHFLVAAAVTALTGLLMWLPFRRDRSDLKIRDGFLLVSLYWALLGVAGAIPFLLGLHLSFTDAVFEAVSGFTTTGATVIVGLDHLPRSVLYHSQQIQWLGGLTPELAARLSVRPRQASASAETPPASRPPDNASTHMNRAVRWASGTDW